VGQACFQGARKDYIENYVADQKGRTKICVRFRQLFRCFHLSVGLAKQCGMSNKPTASSKLPLRL
jgi:hypothetical protein